MSDTTPASASLSVSVVRTLPEAELIAGLRRMTLLNSPVRPYESAEIRLLSVPPDFLFPAAFYVSRPHLQRQRELRTALLAGGIDTLDLHGDAAAVEFRAPDGIWTVIPPVVEFQRETVAFSARSPSDLTHPPAEMELPLVNDGLHRVWLARELGLPVRVITVRGAPPEHPYYAYPASWSAVRLVDEVPTDKNLRKRHRRADYYSLYRDFGPLGVGKPRHPEEIRR